MRTLYIFYRNSSNMYPMNGKNKITIGQTADDHITISSLDKEIGSIHLEKVPSSNKWIVVRNGEKEGALHPDDLYTLQTDGHPLIFLLTDEIKEKQYFYIGAEREVFLIKEKNKLYTLRGQGAFDEPNQVLALKKQTEGWSVEADQRKPVFVNGKKVFSKTMLQPGDSVSFPFFFGTLHTDDILSVDYPSATQAELPKIKLPSSETKAKYPEFRRTPRLIYDLPDEKVTFSFPNQESDQHTRGLWMMILPPFMMLLVMGVIAIIQPRGLFLLISGVMFATTLVTSTVQYFKDKSYRKKQKHKRKRIYNLYLGQKRSELQQLADKQKKVLYYHFPSFENIKTMTNELSGRIWEKTRESHDFLHLRIGRADVPASYEIMSGNKDMANREMDELLEQSRELESYYSNIRDVPLTADLSSGAIGLIGKSKVVKSEIRQWIGQLAFFHSYHDVRFVAVFSEEESKQWEWIKWLPHFQMPDSFAKGLIYNEQTRDQLLSTLYERLRERELDEEKEKKYFMPHFVFFITNRQLIAEHPILEFLEGGKSNLGLTAIFSADTKESLSNNIHTLIRYVNEQEGDILIENERAVHTPFSLDQHDAEGSEKFSRTLKSLKHIQGMDNSIPAKVTFLELLQVKQADDLPIAANWQTNQSARSLAVPIGLKSKKDAVFLNLHEKAHGPHGLLAGTTGSGKSELLQTFILSLAVHFHPHQAAFLLIDYKGGGMAQPFKSIPHLLGTITNIEGSKNFSARALASINSELKRRQRLFDHYSVSHINDYNLLYEAGEAAEPMAHLFIISDEFAELKNEEPDFIRELVSAARIGRSLGVHLILATQKPGGIIDDQIWSNARFRIALKVQDSNDSKEILKNGDAANLTVTGRGFLQVGNNEVYELFQSAWSGAPYQEDTVEYESDISLVTDTGLVPLSTIAAETTEKIPQQQTEIEAVVKAIELTQKEMEINALPSPWLPPLPDRLVQPIGLGKGQYAFAMTDEPDQQRQSSYNYEWMTDGNIGIFGSSGYGKSMTAMTLLLNFARENKPDQLHYYLFDFGNSSLLPLKQLPHTGDYFRYDDMRKIEKFLMRMKREIEQRKQTFLEKEVSTIQMYNMVSKEKLPVIFIAIDNFDAVKEEMPDIDLQFTQFARDGQSLGIFMIFTATRIQSIRQPLMNNLKTKIVHYLMDRTEIYSLLGKPPFEIDAVPGRALIKKETAFLAQVFQPVAGVNDFEIYENMKTEINRLKEKYAGSPRPAAVPMLPARLSMGDFRNTYVSASRDGFLPIGLEEETVTPVYVDLSGSSHCLVMGQSRKGKTNAVKVMIETLIEQPAALIAVSDGIDRGLIQYGTSEKAAYLDSKEDVVGWLDKVETLLKERESRYLQMLGQKEAQEPFPPAVLVIDSLSRFQQITDTLLQDRVAKMMKQYSHIGFRIIAAGNANELMKGFDSLTNEIKQIRQALILMKKSEQSLFTLPFTRKEGEVQPGFGYFVMNGREHKVQIPLC
ncbi:type VII secretion protein EssC [Bacillus aerolatus]|uniref:Type VII secretion protein EssC n=1 Tax=Bacillus aerolatus TaxID=2653354 RepID=A0A6I1FU81_9BACI|nr:type VII secretion protein EssC [Bacillus aerolatus]KAB7708255.1 type VII secretion protein EssC [Bacillus aerolatus]